jgi:gluconolactonase
MNPSSVSVASVPFRDVPITVVGGGFAFVEAPSFDRNGVLFFSEVRTGTVWRLEVDKPDSHATVFHRVASEWCNGTAFHRDGRLFLCDVAAACIWTLDPDGKATLFADRTEDGRRLNGPNDCVFDRNGVLYFTDPFGSSLEKPIGQVCRAFSDGRIERLDSGLAFPNGLALTAAEDALIVDVSRTRMLHRYAIAPDGTVGPREDFCHLPEDGGGPDGMALAADGRLLVTHVGAGCLDVVSPDGRVLERIPTGGPRLSNCAFRGRSLYCTVTQSADPPYGGAIHRLDVDVTGHPLFGEIA